MLLWRSFGRPTFALSRYVHQNQPVNVTEPRGYRSKAAKGTDGALIVCLFLLALFAPHSIAATQTVWVLGMVLWVSRLVLFPAPPVSRTPLDYALLGFFILSGISAFLSYEPFVSIGKLRAASLFTIVYLVAQNIHSRRLVRLLVVTFVASFIVNVLYTAGERLVGRGVRLDVLHAESPLRAVGVKPGDTLLEIDGQKIRTPEDLLTRLSLPDKPTSNIKAYRLEAFPKFAVERGRFLEGSTAQQKLGIAEWSRGRDWRASGFYGHYVTYAEALQLVLAIVVGLLVSLPSRRGWQAILLLMSLSGLLYTLLLTVTRASWLAFLISSAAILMLSVSRRTAVIIGALAIPLVLSGLFVLQQKRNVGFFDRQDQSTTWRETVWIEGLSLLVSNPRHLIVGVGMDSIKKRSKEWGLFDQGRLPMGHMHSNILQLGLERGIPALVFWLILLGLYARLLLKMNRRFSTRNEDSDENDGLNPPLFNLGPWIERGLVLGAFGGLAGFFASGLVHYNWGDSEVVMIFYFIMGLTLALNRLHERESDRGNRA